MKRALVPAVLLGLFAAPCGYADELAIPPVAMPKLPAKAATVQAFVPAGWMVEKQMDGPVDADAKPDVVLMLHDSDPRNVLHNDSFGQPELDTNPRLLVVLTADPAGGYRRIAMSDRLIRRNDIPTMEDVMEGGDVMLANRVLSVRLDFLANMGSWTASDTTYKFRWQDGCMRLIGYDDDSQQRNSGDTEDVSVNLLTNKATRTFGNAESTKTRVKHYTLKPRAPVCLEAVDENFESGVPSD